MEKRQPKLFNRNFFVKEKPVCCLLFCGFKCIHEHQMLEQATKKKEEKIMICDSRVKLFCLTDPVWFLFCTTVTICSKSSSFIKCALWCDPISKHEDRMCNKASHMRLFSSVLIDVNVRQWRMKEVQRKMQKKNQWNNNNNVDHINLSTGYHILISLFWV